MLPISTNMMSGCFNQPERRRSSLPAALTTFNHRRGMDPTKIRPGMHTHTTHTHIHNKYYYFSYLVDQKQKNDALFKRRKSTHNKFTQ